MTLEEKINEDLKTAMKAKDAAGLRGVRAVKSAILIAKTDGSGNEINEEKEIQILQKLIKQREDLAVVESEEIAVIIKYLPAQLEGEALEAELRAIIAETGATSAKDMGKVMGAANKKLAGKADGKSISEVVKKLLS